MTPLLSVDPFVHDMFIAVGIAFAALAVIVTVVGMRSKNFPSKKAMISLIAVGVLLAVGTGAFAVELSVQEAKEREEGEKPVGEEASITPLRIPPSAS